MTYGIDVPRFMIYVKITSKKGASQLAFPADESRHACIKDHCYIFIILPKLLGCHYNLMATVALLHQQFE